MEMGEIKGWILILLIISSPNKADLLGRFALWVECERGDQIS